MLSQTGCVWDQVDTQGKWQPYAPIEFGGGAIPGFAGLGLVFDVETIRETIELFFR